MQILKIMRNVTRRVPGPALVLGAMGLVSACTSSGDCDSEVWPVPTGSAVFVGQCGKADSADGSREAPYTSIVAAAKVAKAGTTIVVGAGTWAESVELPAGVTLVGIHGQTKLTPPAGKMGVHVAATTGAVEVRNIAISGASTAGIRSEGASLAIWGCDIGGTLATPPTFEGGSGVVLVGCAKAPHDANCPNLTVISSNVHNNEGYGVLAYGAQVVNIREPGSKGPRSDTSKLPDAVGPAGLVFPDFKPGSSITGNKQGGVALVFPDFKTAGGLVFPDFLVGISGTLIQGNGQSGLSTYSTGQVAYVVNVDNSLISDTQKATGAAATEAASGIAMLESGPAGATVGKLVLGPGAVIANNAQAGVVVNATAKVEAVVRSDVVGNQFGGIWGMGDGASVELRQEGRVSDNKLMGLAGVDGAQLAVREKARVARTLTTPWQNPLGKSVDLGDGCGVFLGARLTVDQGRFADNARSHIIAHHPASEQGVLAGFTVKGAQFQGGQFGVAINADGAPQLPAGIASDLSSAALGNTFSGVGVPVQTDAKLCVQFQAATSTESFCP